MLPFYHPTTIVALDDDPLFLESFAFHFDDDFLCRTFTQPEQAIRFFADSSQHQRDPGSYFSAAHGTTDGSGSRPGDQLIRLNAAHLGELTRDDTRFQQISLLVVDYAMPGMNGVDVCRHLKDHPSRKILLTGKAGEETAVKAFNEGIIDCFLMKQMADLPRVLDQEMRKLQRQYFSQMTTSLQMALSVPARNIFNHEPFRTYLIKLYEARGIAEYYHHTDPAGVMMITEDGDPHFLVVQDDDAIRSCIEIARSEDAPSDLLALLESRRVVARFPGPDNAYKQDYAETWRKHIWPAHVVTGPSNLYCSLISGDDLDPLWIGDVRTFADYRETQDRI